jgi:hypothetical protein
MISSYVTTLENATTGKVREYLYLIATASVV